jgi:hypothetical protein
MRKINLLITLIIIMLMFLLTACFTDFYKTYNEESVTKSKDNTLNKEANSSIPKVLEEQSKTTNQHFQRIHNIQQALEILNIGKIIEEKHFTMNEVPIKFVFYNDQGKQVEVDYFDKKGKLFFTAFFDPKSGKQITGDIKSKWSFIDPLDPKTKIMIPFPLPEEDILDPGSIDHHIYITETAGGNLRVKSAFVDYSEWASVAAETIGLLCTNKIVSTALSYAIQQFASYIEQEIRTSVIDGIYVITNEDQAERARSYRTGYVTWSYYDGTEVVSYDKPYYITETRVTNLYVTQTYYTTCTLTGKNEYGETVYSPFSTHDTEQEKSLYQDFQASPNYYNDTYILSKTLSNWELDIQGYGYICGHEYPAY